MEGRRLLDDQATTDAEILAEYRRTNNINEAMEQRNMRLKRVQSDAEHEAVYQAFLREIGAKLTELREQNCPYADAANNFIEQIKSVHDSKLQRWQSTQLPVSDLNELLDTTNTLLQTPMLTSDNTLNPDLPQRLQDFQQHIQDMDTYQKDQHRSGLYSAGKALACTIGVVLLAVMVGTLTLGLGAFFAIGGAAVLLGLGAVCAKNSVGFFNRAHKAADMLGNGNTLADAVQNDLNSRPGLN